MAGRWSTSWRVISQEMPPLPDDDPGPQHGDRDAGLTEQTLDLAAAAQVRGEVVVVAAETTEVDDPAQPGLGGGLAERLRRLGVEPREVGVASECTR